MSENSVEIPGLEGGTPLGFLAALGILRILAGDSPWNSTASMPVQLSWVRESGFHPVIHGGAKDLNEVATAVAEDAAAWSDSPVLRFRYPKLERKGAKLVGALQAPVAVFRGWLRELLQAGNLEALEYAAALASETATDASKSPITHDHLREFGIPFDSEAPIDRATMPTVFDFTSRNAQFLEQVDAVRASLRVDTILADLRDGGIDAPAVRTMDWDSTADAPGAIYSGSPNRSRPAAEWLAFRGLAFFPVAGQGGVLQTTACAGRRKSGTFTWPIWNAPADPWTVASLLRCRDLDGLSHAARAERGIVRIFRAQLTKKADGYSGMFSPAEPI